MAEPGLWLAEVDRLRPELFGKNRALAAELLGMTAAGKPTDIMAVRAWLTERGIEHKASDLMTLSDYAPVSRPSMTHAVDVLHEAAKIAGIRELASRLLRQADTRGVKADEILTAGILGLSDIGVQSTRQIQPISKVLRKVMENISKPVTGAIKTGIRGVDKTTSGFKPGELVLLGARPSMGKTAFALGIARQAALAGRTVAIFSLEMSPAQVVERMLADLASVDLVRIVTHTCGDTDISRVTNAAGAVDKMPVFIAEDADQIGSVCRQLKHQEGLELVIVDYLQLMSARGESRERAVGDISRGLKRLAKQLRIPILCLSQLNRALEARSNKQPQLSDLRESGSLEQDADQVLFLYREHYYNPDADPTKAELNVAKNRSGPTGYVDLTWSPESARFSPAPN
jgi:replicative DNA helicase